MHRDDLEPRPEDAPERTEPPPLRQIESLCRRSAEAELRDLDWINRSAAAQNSNSPHLEPPSRGLSASPPFPLSRLPVSEVVLCMPPRISSPAGRYRLLHVRSAEGSTVVVPASFWLHLTQILQNCALSISPQSAGNIFALQIIRRLLFSRLHARRRNRKRRLKNSSPGDIFHCRGGVSGISTGFYVVCGVRADPPRPSHPRRRLLQLISNLVLVVADKTSDSPRKAKTPRFERAPDN
ncbi:hypothetical protein Zmor_009685 [Zophobas morio]|uniref:Uncharacterized protein n=1 Tax=Zophobas morio TaxID=2755281 RepID=A0AA38MJ29_9CUCU|nr:hypothetical protein Zmor_009685 [Zophobas morio]